MAMQWTQTQKLICHLKFVIYTRKKKKKKKKVSCALSVRSVLSSSTTEYAVKPAKTVHMSLNNSLICSASVFADREILLEKLFFCRHRISATATCNPSETAIQ